MLNRQMTVSAAPFKVRCRVEGKEPKEYDHPAGRDIELASLMARRRYQEETGLSQYLRHKVITELIGPTV